MVMAKLELRLRTAQMAAEKAYFTKSDNHILLCRGQADIENFES